MCKIRESSLKGVKDLSNDLSNNYVVGDCWSKCIEDAPKMTPDRLGKVPNLSRTLLGHFRKKHVVEKHRKKHETKTVKHFSWEVIRMKIITDSNL